MCIRTYVHMYLCAYSYAVPAFTHSAMLVFASPRYDDLLSAVSDRKDALDKALFQANEFDELYTTAMDWMGQTYAKLKEEGPIHSELEEVKQQVEDHKVGSVGWGWGGGVYELVCRCELGMNMYRFVHCMYCSVLVYIVYFENYTPIQSQSPIPCNAGITEGA